MLVNFVKTKTEAQAVTESTQSSHTGTVYFPTDTTNIVLNGKKYGSEGNIRLDTTNDLRTIL